MANQHKHPTRGIRGIATPVWNDYTDAVARAGTDLSTPLRQFVDWYRGVPGAELPHRPAPSEITLP